MFEIEKGIQMPIQYRKRKYPLAEMVIGDSFFVEGESRSTLTSSASYFKIAHPDHKGKFSIRKVDGGFRCWLIEE